MRINPVTSTEARVERTPAESTPIRPIEPVMVNNRGQQDEEVQRELSQETLEHYIDELNKVAEWTNKLLRFSLHEASDRMQVLVVNNKNQEIIKEIPPEEVLDLIGRIREMVGVLLDERV